MTAPAQDVAREWARLCPHDDAVTSAVLADLLARWT